MKVAVCDDNREFCEKERTTIKDVFKQYFQGEDLQLKDTEAIKKVEEELNQKYDMENVFNKKKTKKNVNNSSEEMGLTVYKERFIKKIFNLIKGIFKK